MDKGAAKTLDKKLAKWTKVIAITFFVLVLAGMMVSKFLSKDALDAAKKDNSTTTSTTSTTTTTTTGSDATTTTTGSETTTTTTAASSDVSE